MILFDANGSSGKPASGGAAFPAIRDRLNHMDRLGISRALVWNTESTQDHSLSCNRRLLNEIAATPGAEKRIIPCLTISGLITYEKNGIGTLLDQMEEGHTRALRFTNVFGRLTLRQLEPVVGKIRHLKPFILLNAPEILTMTVRDVLDFTDLFPGIPVVLTEAMWPHGIIVFDVMRQRKNILLETSCWHTWEGIRLAVRQFGAERILFGTGHRSHNGASIAALARADISDRDRELIAHGNLDRLTGTKTEKATTAVEEKNKGALWNRLLAGQPLGVDIVDAHGHLGPSAGYVLEAQMETDQIPELIRVMDGLGQGTMILSGLNALLGNPVKGNESLLDILAPYPDRFLAYAVFNPFYGDELLPRLDDYFARPQVVGFKVLASYWRVPVTDTRFQPVWEYANRRRLPILLHSWVQGIDSPFMLRDIAGKYPDASFLLGHAGGGDDGRHEAEEMAAEFPNVYLEWCGSFTSTVPWEETLRKVKPEQVVYGTDAAAHDAHWELGRLLSLDVPDDILRTILGANMRAILARRR